MSSSERFVHSFRFLVLKSGVSSLLLTTRIRADACRILLHLIDFPSSRASPAIARCRRLIRSVDNTPKSFIIVAKRSMYSSVVYLASWGPDHLFSSLLKNCNPSFRGYRFVGWIGAYTSSSKSSAGDASEVEEDLSGSSLPSKFLSTGSPPSCSGSSLTIVLFARRGKGVVFLWSSGVKGGIVMGVV